MNSSEAEVFRFGPFRLMPARREFYLRDVPVALGSRAFDLLVALVRRKGDLATKDELMTEVWSGVIVDENNLAAQISAIRKVLAAEPDFAASLRTVPGRGYRFVAPLEAAVEAESGGAEALSIVVLPFANLSADIEQAHFAQGMTDAVTSGLSRIPGLMVISATAAAMFEGQVDIREIHRQLGVRFVLRGSVQQSGDSVRISAQLVEGRTRVQLWSEVFDGARGELFALQDRITGAIAISIGREIFAAVARDGEARNIDPKAADLVMRGVAADSRPQTLERLQEQERLFAQALRLDPKNGDALARLARAILLQSSQAHAPASFREEALKRGAEAAERALALDPNNARAHLAMSYLHVLRGDFERSIAACERAIALDRNLAMAHNMLATSYVHLGKGHEGVRAAATALRLDPIGPQFDVYSTTMGLARLVLGELGEASTCFNRARAANPRLARAHAGAAIALAAEGKLSAAREAAADLLRVAPAFRLSETIDACLPSSPPEYRRFYEEVLRPAAVRAGVPI